MAAPRSAQDVLATIAGIVIAIVLVVPLTWVLYMIPTWIVDWLVPRDPGQFCLGEPGCQSDFGNASQRAAWIKNLGFVTGALGPTFVLYLLSQFLGAMGRRADEAAQAKAMKTET